MHCERNKASVYSINEWKSYCSNFQELIKIPFIRNYRIQKLFDIWRKFLIRSKKLFVTERLKEKLQALDEYLRKGMMEIRRILSEMTFIKLFSNVNFDIKFYNLI